MDEEKINKNTVVIAVLTALVFIGVIFLLFSSFGNDRIEDKTTIPEDRIILTDEEQAIKSETIKRISTEERIILTDEEKQTKEKLIESIKNK